MEAARSKVVRREPCGYCRAGGGDRSGDNMVVYADGGKHCFACGRHEWPSPWEQLSKIAKEPAVEIKDVNDLDFPKDYMLLTDAIYAKTGLHWLRNFGITEEEIKRNRIGWSNDRQLLVFPVFNVNNQLVMWQGRNFAEGQKYLTYGEKRDIMHLVGNNKSSICILTEDYISAMKVGRKYEAAPLFGAELSLGLIKELSARFDELGIWLDANKVKESVKHAMRASQYIPTFVVNTPYDPKAYSYDTMVERVEEARKETIYKEDMEDHSPKSQAQMELEYPPSRPEAEERLRRAIVVAQVKKRVMGRAGVPARTTKASGMTHVSACYVCGRGGLMDKCPTKERQDADNCPIFASTLIQISEPVFGKPEEKLVMPEQLTDVDQECKDDDCTAHMDGGQGDHRCWAGCPAGALCLSVDGTECKECRDFDVSNGLKRGEENFGRQLFKDAWPAEHDESVIKYPFPFEPFTMPHEEKDWGAYKKDSSGS